MYYYPIIECNLKPKHHVSRDSTHLNPKWTQKCQSPESEVVDMGWSGLSFVLRNFLTLLFDMGHRIFKPLPSLPSATLKSTVLLSFCYLLIHTHAIKPLPITCKHAILYDRQTHYWCIRGLKLNKLNSFIPKLKPTVVPLALDFDT